MVFGYDCDPGSADWLAHGGPFDEIKCSLYDILDTLLARNPS
jgi:hypothetical protein